MIKKFFYIFIPILAVLFMSHNVSAASQTFYLKNGIYAYGIPHTTGGQGGDSQTLLTGQTYNMRNNTYAFDGTKIWYSMGFYLNSEHTAIDISQYTDFTFTFTYCSDINYFMPSSNDYFRMTDYYEFEADVTKQLVDFRDTTNPDVDIKDIERCRNVMLVGKNATGSPMRTFDVGTSANGSFTRIFGIMPYEAEGFAKALAILSPTVVFYDNPNEADQAIQKEKQNVQNAANNSATSGSNSTSNSQNATSSLLSVITAGVGAITSASPTNCQINGNMGNLNVGNIDLCANPVPTFMALIGSIIAVLVVLPLVIVLFNRFISIIRSFQR